MAGFVSAVDTHADVIPEHTFPRCNHAATASEEARQTTKERERRLPQRLITDA